MFYFYIFSIYYYFYLFLFINKYFIILVSKTTFLCYSLYSSSSECVCTHIYTRHTLLWIFFTFVDFISLARASDYRPQLVLLFSVILESSTSGSKWQMFIQIEDILVLFTIFYIYKVHYFQ